MPKKSPAKPQTHNGNLAELPSALAPLTDETRWVNWSWELRKNKDGKQEWTKPPRRPLDRTFAKSNDRSTWGSYERAVHRWENGDADGIGVMLLDYELAAADFDDCCQRDAVKKRTTIDAWAQALRKEAPDAYCEVTVSGTGLRLIGTATGEEVHRRFPITNARPDAKLELFRDTARFITISALQLGACQHLPPLDEFIDALLARYDQRKEQAAPGRQQTDRDWDDIIRNGAPPGDRSELFHGSVWHLANKGLSIEHIVDKLGQYPNGIALKYADRLHQEVTRSYEKWRHQNPVEPQGLPIIRSIDGQIARMVDEAQTALIGANVPIFVRGGMLVEPITVEREAADKRKTMVTVFAPLSLEKLVYVLNKNAAVFKRKDLKQKKWVTIDPPPKVAAALLNLRNWGFPEVVGIVGVPTMRPDGSILRKVGYDPATRLWCNSDVELPTIPERPTIEEAKRALQLLKKLLSGFPFVGTVDQSVALAAIHSAVLRGAFDLLPLLAVLAHDSGTGKSFLVDLVAVLVTGRPCPVITGSKSAEEMEKRLSSVLLEGSLMNSLDNLSHDIEGDLLAQMVTQTVIKVRILGKSELAECENRGMLLATGNNVRVVGDMIRRTLVSWLDAKVERPETRKFEFDPIKRVLDSRGAYLAAIFTIARAYLVATSKVTNVQPLVGFEGWCKVVREPLIWLGEPDPVASMEAAREADPERVAAHELVRRWSKAIGTGKAISVRAMIEKINEALPKFRAFLLEHAGTTKGDQIDPVRLGKWLRKEQGRVYDNVRIDIVRHKGKGNEYVLRKIEDREDD
jgi:putative DNA primase/helicase